MKELIGTGVALVTPFTKKGEVDFNALERLVNFQIDNGIDYLVILGTTGEPATLSKEEQKEVIAKIIEVNNNRLPLVIGIGGNATRDIIKEIETTDLTPFCAILSVSPYYNKPTQEGIHQHFKAIANSTEKPIILYNVPHRTGRNVEPTTVVKLAEECSNIVAVKDAANDMNQTFEILKNRPKGFHVISGEDALAMTSTLAGGSGVISVIGQGIPKEFSNMINHALQKEVEKAYDIYYRIMDLTTYVFKEGNPIGIKSILNHQGICEIAVRLPLVQASQELHNLLKKELKAIAD